MSLEFVTNLGYSYNIRKVFRYITAVYLDALWNEFSCLDRAEELPGKAGREGRVQLHGSMNLQIRKEEGIL